MMISFMLETPLSLPYVIRRSRMHNIPVYSDIKHGNQKNTIVRKVEGDIWVGLKFLVKPVCLVLNVLCSIALSV